ncbi:Maf-like protein YhdE [Rubripirellula tenax]|uniref:dTTP/UTP pyrophosphatase n=2 Tax=Rubripirellula tenax TaxID=2528015 RepID=A0A5C6FK09_9BACT|nr:Maf-like protein YhdE [Rubripirellula tenax]
MSASEDLPLMRDLPHATLPTDEPIILASGSPRRAQLMKAAGYDFSVIVASDEAECGMCSRETAPEMVARYAYRKAADVATKVDNGLIIAADTVASCVGQILGKPRDQDHAEATLRLLSGRRHDVYTGVCIWSVKLQKCTVDVVRTELMMQPLSDSMLEGYLDSMLWEGKAGAFGYQDGNDWLSIVGEGSESNVVGLPMERLAELLEKFDSIAETVITGITEPPG